MSSSFGWMNLSFSCPRVTSKLIRCHLFLAMVFTLSTITTGQVSALKRPTNLHEEERNVVTDEVLQTNEKKGVVAPI